MTNFLCYLTKRIEACQQTFSSFCGKIDSEKQRAQSGRKKNYIVLFLTPTPLLKRK